MTEREYAPTYELPRGPRDTRSWYLDADPMAQVDYSLVDFAATHAGRSLLDLGCGIGGYSRALTDRGFAVQALDVVPATIAREHPTAQIDVLRGIYMRKLVVGDDGRWSTSKQARSTMHS